MDSILKDEDRNYSNFSFYIDNRSRGGLSQTWILFDNQSIINIFCNCKLLNNTRTVDEYVTMNCNAGVTTTNQVRYLKGVGAVWYNPDGIANILSVSRMEEQ